MRPGYLATTSSSSALAQPPVAGSSVIPRTPLCLCSWPILWRQRGPCFQRNRASCDESFRDQDAAERTTPMATRQSPGGACFRHAHAGVRDVPASERPPLPVQRQDIEERPGPFASRPTQPCHRAPAGRRSQADQQSCYAGQQRRLVTPRRTVTWKCQLRSTHAIAPDRLVSTRLSSVSTRVVRGPFRQASEGAPRAHRRGQLRDAARRRRPLGIGQAAQWHATTLRRLGA